MERAIFLNGQTVAYKSSKLTNISNYWKRRIHYLHRLYNITGPQGFYFPVWMPDVFNDQQAEEYCKKLIAEKEL